MHMSYKKVFLPLCIVLCLLTGCAGNGPGEASAPGQASSREAVSAESQIPKPAPSEQKVPEEVSEEPAGSEAASPPTSSETSLENEFSVPQSGELSETDGEPVEQNDLGRLSPEAALEYMQATENLVIVDVASRTNYGRAHFEGAINIPIEDLNSEEEDALYLELPGGIPVLLHCRLGMIVPGAYRRVKELRPDIPEIAYIDGAPPFEAYNEWYAENH